jgi:hypothetical protein
MVPTLGIKTRVKPVLAPPKKKNNKQQQQKPA